MVLFYIGLDDEEEEGAEEMAMGAEADMGMEEPAEEAAESNPADEAAVERLVQVVVDALASEVPEMDIELENTEDAAEMDMGMAGDELDGDEEAAMRDPAMRDPAMRDEKGMEEAKNADDEDEDEEEVSEKLNLEVLDDENLTEAVLKRVVERLLRLRRK